MVVLRCDICDVVIQNGNEKKYITGKIITQKSTGPLLELREVCEPCIDKVNIVIKNMQCK